MTPTRTRTALVIGAGIAGPVTAMALHKAGIDATVYEARDPGAPDAGMFLTLGSNGIDALRALDAAEPVLAVGFSTPEIVLRSGTGRHLGASRTGPALADGTTSQTVKRADLCRVLRAEAVRRGVVVESGKRLVAAERTGAGVRAVFADGTSATGDVLIGCDGVHSTVRRIIDPAAPAPTYAGLISTGGYTRAVPVDTAPGSYEMIFGRRAFFGYAMAGGTASTAPGDEVWWFANLPRRGEPARGELESVGDERWRRCLVELFAGDAGPAVALVRAADRVPAPTPVHTIPHLPAWHDDRMIVIGDAAHAPSPTSGQGAALSIEDAVLLARCLRDVPDPAAAFARLVAVRRPRVERIIKWAARINNSKAAGPVGRVIRDAVLPSILRMTADSGAYRRIYDHHIDWDQPVRG